MSRTRQEFADERLAGALGEVGLLLHAALAKVLELGLKAAQVIEVLIALGGQHLDRIGRRFGRHDLLGRGHNLVDRLLGRELGVGH